MQTQIPLKKVSIKHIVKANNTCIKLTLNGLKFIGTEYYQLREDLAPEAFVNRIRAQPEKSPLKHKSFEYLSDPDGYKCSDEGVDYRMSDKDTIVLKTNIGNVGINYNFYSYFKNLGAQLRFSGVVSPIGMFKNDEFMGILFPVRIREE